MPFVQRVIAPKFLSKTKLWTEDGKPKIEDHELEAVTNNTLSNALRQLASLLLVAEDIFCVLGDELKEINRRSETLKARIAKVDRKVADFDPKKVSVRLFLCIIEGTGIAWSSPMLKKLNGTDDNPLKRKISTDESSLLASLPILGSIFASFLLMIISGKLGRKPLLALHGMASLICYVILAFSANIWCYCVARFISGLNSAVMSTILPLYICELADSSSRGSLAAGMIVSVNIGILIAFIGGPYIPFIWYHSLMALMPICFIITFSIFALESPYYNPQGDSSRTEELLKKLRGVDDVTDEVNEIKRCLEETSEENFFEQIKLKGPRKAFMLGVGLVILSTSAGANVVITYAQMIFDSAEGNWSGEVDNIIVGTVQLVVSVIAAIVMDKFQRKHLMIASASMQALSMALLSLYLILKNKGVDVEAFRWAPLLCFLGYVSFYNIGVGPLWNTVVGELLPQGIKNTAMSFCGLLFGGIIFVFTITFQRIEQSMGLGQTLIFFSIMSLLTAVYVAIFIVETNGKTLEEIQLELNGKKLKTAPL